MNDEKFVCFHCFGDSGIRQFIKWSAESNKCNFCRKKSKSLIACPLDTVAEFIEERIRTEYDDAADNLPWENAEGGYQWTHWDTWDLLAEEICLELPRDSNGSLFEAIYYEIGDNTWCEINPFGLNDYQFAEFSWGNFCRIVEQERRFFFIKYGEEDKFRESLLPGEMLETFSEYAKEIGLFKYLHIETKLHRARYQKTGEILSTSLQLGPPPSGQSKQSNRMSPPGIVMFYLSDSPQTALRETAKDPGTFVVGEFQIQRQAVILDLTHLPRVPTLFEEGFDYETYGPEAKKKLLFIHHIADSISRPIARDDRVHISYVPTQVVTEYIRDHVHWNNLPIDGICYSSAVYPGHNSYVLFANQENIVIPENETLDSFWPAPDKDRWIKLLSRKTYKLSARKLEGWKKDITYYKNGD